jgi:hypothetical protein
VSTFNIVTTVVSVVLLLPLVIYSIANGSVAPKGSRLEKYYEVEKNIGLAGNLFLLAACVFSLAKLAAHFGLIDKNAQDTFAEIIALPTMLLCFAYSWLWLRAWRKVHSSENDEV